VPDGTTVRGVDAAEVAGLLGGGEVDDLRRLSGGASRETWAFRRDGRRLVLQRDRPGAVRLGGGMGSEVALLRAAATVGVPVPAVVAADVDGERPWMVLDHVDGETIPRRILRDDAYAEARPRLAEQCGRALAGVHRIPLDVAPDLVASDALDDLFTILDTLGEPHPAFELGLRWLAANRPQSHGRAVVHGDFRHGNLIVGPDGLRAVIDWELAHVGDPMEDLGWLCVRAWRFGGPLPVGGFGRYDDLFAAYGAAAGVDVDPEVVHWWEVLGTVRWGVICIAQARAHLDGHVRSVELATIGRRVCENEHDVLALLP
jgi:aminoglycoside phosphotransferase (APT) family kinase protein